MFETGYLQIAKLKGAPVRVHWSVAIGAVLFTGFRVAPAAWLGFVLLVLVHELGHAAFVLRYRLELVSIDVHGFGGICHWRGSSTAWRKGIIAWGGVVAQLALLLLAYGFVLVTGGPTTEVAAELISVFTVTNLWLILINLLPVPPLDGADAWTVFRLWREGRSGREARAAAARDLRHIEHAERHEKPLTEEDAARLRRLFDDSSRRAR